MKYEGHIFPHSSQFPRPQAAGRIANLATFRLHRLRSFMLLSPSSSLWRKRYFCSFSSASPSPGQRLRKWGLRGVAEMFCFWPLVVKVSFAGPCQKQGSCKSGHFLFPAENWSFPVTLFRSLNEHSHANGVVVGHTSGTWVAVLYPLLRCSLCCACAHSIRYHGVLSNLSLWINIYSWLYTSVALCSKIQFNFHFPSPMHQVSCDTLCGHAHL